MLDLGNGASVSLILVGLVSGTSDPASDSVDMAGFEGCLFVGVIGAQDAAAQAALEVQESDDDATWVPIASHTAPVNSDNKIFVIDVHRPKRRYLRTLLTRSGTTNTTWGGTLAIRYNPRGTPIPAEASHALAPLQLVSPADA